MQSIIVTGANGQLGNEIRRLVSNDVHYIFTDIEELNITNREAIREMMQKEKIEVVINCAAYTNVDKAEDDVEMADMINNKAVENLAVVCNEQNACLLHVSTDYVFPGIKNTPYREDEQTNPLGVYGTTKLAGEIAVQKAGCRYMIFRTSWLYSSYGNNFVKTMLRLTSEREKLNVVFDQVGTPTFAGDLAAVLLHVIEKQKYLQYQGIYHYSNEGVCSWYDFAKEIAYLAGNSNCDIQACHSDEFPSKVKRPAFSVLDKSKLKVDLGIIVPYWKDSLKRCLDELIA